MELGTCQFCKKENQEVRCVLFIESGLEAFICDGCLRQKGIKEKTGLTARQMNDEYIQALRRCKEARL